jgi:hypothetical protein
MSATGYAAEVYSSREKTGVRYCLNVNPQGGKTCFPVDAGSTIIQNAETGCSFDWSPQERIANHALRREGL